MGLLLTKSVAENSDDVWISPVIQSVIKLFSIGVIFLLFSSVGSTSVESKRPNIVFILVDDLRWNTLGCMGDTIVQTPHIDALAKKGVLFRNAFVTTSICAVSRASLLTGQWQRRHGVDNFSKGINEREWEQTYPAKLRTAGYRTGFIGKFGVGDAKEIAAKATAFDYWRGLPGQAGEYFYESNDPKRMHATARFGDQALEFLAHSKSEQPFCVSISFNAVHARDNKPREFQPDQRDESLYETVRIPLPRTATDEAHRRLPSFVQSSEGRKRWHWRFDSEEKAQNTVRDYYRLITGVDRELGRIVDELQKHQLSENTIIIFTSDNGFALGDRGLADKWFMYEENIRVPLIIFDPRLPAQSRGRAIDAMALNVDVAPTMLEMAGVTIPPVMQGRSLTALLKKGVPPDWRKEFFYEHHTEPKRIPPSEGVRTERWKYIRWLDPNPLVEELYDLTNDPDEERNLAHVQEHQERIGQLRRKWEAYSIELK